MTKKRKSIRAIENVIDSNSLRVRNISKRKRTKNCDLDVIFPQYGKKSQYWDYINSDLKRLALGELIRGQRDSNSWYTEFVHDMIPTKSYLQFSISEHWVSNEFISFVTNQDSYWFGAAHPNTIIQTRNYLGSGCGLVKISELFEIDEAGAKRILDVCSTLIQLEYSDEDEEPLNLNDHVFDNAMSMIEQFNIEEAGVSFIFGAASGLARVCGVRFALIPWQNFNFRPNADVSGSKIANWIENRF